MGWVSAPQSWSLAQTPALPSHSAVATLGDCSWSLSPLGRPSRVRGLPGTPTCPHACRPHMPESRDQKAAPGPGRGSQGSGTHRNNEAGSCAWFTRVDEGPGRWQGRHSRAVAQEGHAWGCGGVRGLSEGTAFTKECSVGCRWPLIPPCSSSKQDWRTRLAASVFNPAVKDRSAPAAPQWLLVHHQLSHPPLRLSPRAQPLGCPHSHPHSRHPPAHGVGGLVCTVL